MKKREVSKWFYTILYLLYLADAAMIVLFFHFPLGMTQVPLLMGLVTVWIHRYGKDSNRVIQVTIPLLASVYHDLFTGVCAVGIDGFI